MPTLTFFRYPDTIKCRLPTPWQLAQYLETARETEPFDPSLFEPRWHPELGEEEIDFDAEEIEDMRKDDIRQCTRDLLLVERAREWLLAEDEAAS